MASQRLGGEPIEVRDRDHLDQRIMQVVFQLKVREGKLVREGNLYEGKLAKPSF